MKLVHYFLDVMASRSVSVSVSAAKEDAVVCETYRVWTAVCFSTSTQPEICSWIKHWQSEKLMFVVRNASVSLLCLYYISVCLFVCLLASICFVATMQQAHEAEGALGGKSIGDKSVGGCPLHSWPYHHTLPYNTLPYHTIPHHTIPVYIIPYCTIPYHI